MSDNKEIITQTLDLFIIQKEIRDVFMELKGHNDESGLKSLLSGSESSKPSCDDVSLGSFYSNTHGSSPFQELQRCHKYQSIPFIELDTIEGSGLQSIRFFHSLGVR